MQNFSLTSLTLTLQLKILACHKNRYFHSLHFLLLKNYFYFPEGLNSSFDQKLYVSNQATTLFYLKVLNPFPKE